MYLAFDSILAAVVYFLVLTLFSGMALVWIVRRLLKARRIYAPALAVVFIAGPGFMSMICYAMSVTVFSDVPVLPSLCWVAIAVIFGSCTVAAIIAWRRSDQYPIELLYG